MKRVRVCQGNHDAAYTALHHNIKGITGRTLSCFFCCRGSNRTLCWGHTPLNTLTLLWVYSLVLCILSHSKQASFLTISLFHTHIHALLALSIWYVLNATDVRSPTSIYNIKHQQPSQAYSSQQGDAYLSCCTTPMLCMLK